MGSPTAVTVDLDAGDLSVARSRFVGCARSRRVPNMERLRARESSRLPAADEGKPPWSRADKNRSERNMEILCERRYVRTTVRTKGNPYPWGAARHRTVRRGFLSPVRRYFRSRRRGLRFVAGRGLWARDRNTHAHHAPIASCKRRRCFPSASLDASDRSQVRNGCYLRCRQAHPAPAAKASAVRERRCDREYDRSVNWKQETVELPGVSPRTGMRDGRPSVTDVLMR